MPLVGSVLIFSIAGLYVFAFIRERPRAAKQMERIAILKGEKQILLDTTLVARGKKDYGDNGCSGCHAIAKSGGTTGPDLTRAGLLHPDRDWQIQHLIKPDSKVPGSTMPPYGQLQRSEINALAEYMLSLR
jgi:cbb3-type cytochrome oxidase cytochrome c subunit